MKRRDKGAVIFVSSVNAFAPVGYSAVCTAVGLFLIFLSGRRWDFVWGVLVWAE